MATYPQSITTGSTIFETAGYPTYPGGGYHGGIDTVHNDLLAYSPQAGTVVVAHTWDGHTTDPSSVESWGNYVVVQFGPNQYYLAAHFTQQTHHVGEEIARGGYLGQQGETGNVTGVHTHWEYWNGGQSTRYRADPSAILGIPNGRGTYEVSWDAEEPGPGPGPGPDPGPHPTWEKIPVWLLFKMAKKGGLA